MFYTPSQDFRQKNRPLIQSFFFASDLQMLQFLLQLSLRLQIPDRRLRLQVRPLLQVQHRQLHQLLQLFLQELLQQESPLWVLIPSANH